MVSTPYFTPATSLSSSSESIASLTGTELTEIVAADAAEAIAAGAGSEVAVVTVETAAVGAEAATAAAGGAGALAAVGAATGIAALLLSIGVVLAEMFKTEHISISIKNRTPFAVRVFDTYVKHGKETGNTLYGYIGPCQPDKSDSNEVPTGTYSFSKHDAALFGTEGTLQLEFRDPAPDNGKSLVGKPALNWKWFAVGWSVPELGSNKTATGAWYPNAKTAFQIMSGAKTFHQTDLEDRDANGVLVRTFRITSKIDHATGGDIAMLVDISMH